MSKGFEDPFGLGVPRKRLSEPDMVERMIEAGARRVESSGLRIGFDFLRLEDVIADAGVSRSAVYKRWPRKEQYYAELLLRLAGDVRPSLAAYDTGTPETVIAVAEEHVEWFGSEEGRWRVFIEMCRRGSHQNFIALRSRPDWQVYMTLHAAHLTIPDGEYKRSLGRALRASETSFGAQMESFYAIILGLLGYRIKPGILDHDLRRYVMLGAAAVEGVVLTSGVNDDLADHRFLMDPFNVGRLQDWSHAAFLYTSLAVASAEPDPNEQWTDERVAMIPEAISWARGQLAAQQHPSASPPPEV